MVYGFNAFENEAHYIVFQVKLIITRMTIRTNTLDLYLLPSGKISSR